MFPSQTKWENKNSYKKKKNETSLPEIRNLCAPAYRDMIKVLTRPLLEIKKMGY